ncbi:MAG TPA: hypothetical protein DCF68_18010 [Cyanothece sp. UBA12306]|nr:hypothetical protein [Cyanothece sp. UBA12306]
MSASIIWQQESNNRDNQPNLVLVSRWWESLEDQEINWQQRLIPENGNLEDIDWETQRFDSKLSLKKLQIRGITLYWQKNGEDYEQNITPRKLELNPNEQYLQIYPESQPKLVIRITKPPQYQTLELTDPLLVGKSVGDDYLLLIRDQQHKLEIKINLSNNNWQQVVKNLNN